MKFTLEQLNIAHSIMRYCEEKIYKNTGLSVRLHLLNATLEDKQPEEILKKIAESLNMSFEDYSNKSKKSDYVDLRFVAAVILHEYFPKLPAVSIAQIFGGQDHSSVLNARQKGQEYLGQGDERFSKKYNIATLAIEQWLIEN